MMRMRMICWLAILLASVCQVKGESFQIKVEVKGIRGETGNVLVMAQQKDNDQPVYGMAKACKGHVVVTLENVPWDSCIISVFHDENGDWKMNMDEKGLPLEGFARSSYTYNPDKPVCKLKLYYMDRQ